MNNLSVVKVRAPCKRKATESITERPAKLIRTAVQEEDDDGDSEITVNDVKTVVLLPADKSIQPLPTVASHIVHI